MTDPFAEEEALGALPRCCNGATGPSLWKKREVPLRPQTRPPASMEPQDQACGINEHHGRGYRAIHGASMEPQA
jgi:hypothetical protein